MKGLGLKYPDVETLLLEYIHVMRSLKVLVTTRTLLYLIGETFAGNNHYMRQCDLKNSSYLKKKIDNPVMVGRELLIGTLKIPITLKYPQLEPFLEKFLEFSAFIKWKESLETEINEKKVDIKSIMLHDVDMFGNKIGFVKFSVDISYQGVQLPGIVFCRGPSVAILILVKSENKDYAVCTRQARIPVGSLDFLELPAGMMDDCNSFKGVAVQELKEECGININQSKLIPLNTPLAPSPGGCDEFIQLFYCEIEMNAKEINDMQKKLYGLQDHGERIRLTVIPVEELYQSGSMTAITAVLLYTRLNSNKTVL